MDKYITGAVIRKLREQKGLTQEELAGKLFVSSKAVSKWETGQGLPDITLLEPLARALDISVIELFAGENVQNNNRNANILRSKCYVCPVCGNGILSLGEAVISCCGITLPPLEAEKPDEEHLPEVSVVEDEYFVSLPHAMEKDHFITFMAAISDDGMQFVKLYPESNAETRFKTSRVKWLYWYCSRHGLFRMHIRSLMK